MDLSHRMHKPIQERIIFDSDFETLEGLVNIAVSRVQKGEKEVFLKINIFGVKPNMEIHYTLGTRTVKTAVNVFRRDTPGEFAYRKLKRLIGDYALERKGNYFFFSKG